MRIWIRDLLTLENFQIRSVPGCKIQIEIRDKHPGSALLGNLMAKIICFSVKFLFRFALNKSFSPF
jgi:hypothetical protein